MCFAFKIATTKNCLLIKTADLHHCFAIMVKGYHSYKIVVVKSQRIAVRSSTEHKVLSLGVLGINIRNTEEAV